MTEEMLGRSRATATAMGLRNVEFRQGVIEDLPIEDGSVDVVISNGVINLCADKRQVFAEVMRVLKPGGRLQFADIANGKEVPAGALRNIDLWTDRIAGGLPCAGWRYMLEQSGLVDVRIGPPVDTFGGAGGESKARLFEVFGYAFLAHKPK
jgi:arsenite methyltransferase